MPQIFKVGSYWVYFWSDESKPLEPVHVHIAEGRPTSSGTKVWITRSGKCLLAHNNGKIDDHVLRNIIRIIEARSNYIINKWYDHFGETDFYC
ncbi:MAG: DUF4160 domain-containing protein [Clostridia bacterium]|nr:DUF4160 domain-containing protein [Clostridia bacterium]